MEKVILSIVGGTIVAVSAAGYTNDPCDQSQLVDTAVFKLHRNFKYEEVFELITQLTSGGDLYGSLEDAEDDIEARMGEEPTDISGCYCDRTSTRTVRAGRGISSEWRTRPGW